MEVTSGFFLTGAFFLGSLEGADDDDGAVAAAAAAAVGEPPVVVGAFRGIVNGGVVSVAGASVELWGGRVGSKRNPVAVASSGAGS